MIVKLRRRNRRYPDLTAGQPYVVIGVEADDYRILNDKGRPYLYPAPLFTVIDAREPADWVTEIGQEGERYLALAPTPAPAPGPWRWSRQDRALLRAG